MTLDAPKLASSSARRMGAYYTPSAAARVLARWALRRRGDRVLEPSIGDGAFLLAIDRESARRRLSAEVWGVELAADTFAATVSRGLLRPDHAHCADFLAVEPFDVDAVVGNPPYVRLRHLPPRQARLALAVGGRVLDEPIDPSGSVWMPFVLHATEFLARGGRLALVLPYDLTYVRYARPLWRFLGRRFGSLRVVRVRDRMFPEILQETVLLLADGFGASTAQVAFEAYDTVAALEAGRPDVDTAVAVADLVDGERACVEALLRDDVRALLRERVERLTVPARELVTFNIGYVSGDKAFFHPSPATVERFGLPARSLRPALTSSREVRGIGVRTSAVEPERRSRLYLPQQERLTAADREYIRHGERLGVADRYKCRVRDPWFVVPHVRVPDVLLPVFSERPALIVNDARLAASNSLLCGYGRGLPAASLVGAWFTSLTLLQLELHVHALGGGVMVVVPREAGNVRLPRLDRVGADRLTTLDELLVDEKVELAFASGDEPVLRGVLGLTAGEVGLIQEAVDTLAHWRTAARL